MKHWQPYQYRLLVLTTHGRIIVKARGSLGYLLQLPTRRGTRGRQWVDYSSQPSVNRATEERALAQT